MEGIYLNGDLDTEHSMFCFDGVANHYNCTGTIVYRYIRSSIFIGTDSK